MVGVGARVLVEELLDFVLVVVQRGLAGRAGVDQLDQVLDVAVEHVDADHAAAAEAVLVAEVDAPGGFRLQLRIADEVVVAELAFE